jgi:hypothetical protein
MYQFSTHVIIYSYEEDQFIEIPASELAPGMIYVLLPGGERAWVSVEEFIKYLPVPEQKLPPSFVAMATPVLRSFRDALPCNPAELVKQFAREPDFQIELNLWECMRAIWMERLDAYPYTPKARVELFRLIVQMTFSEEGHVEQVFTPEHLSKEQFKQIVESQYVEVHAMADLPESPACTGGLGAPRLYAIGALK